MASSKRFFFFFISLLNFFIYPVSSEKVNLSIYYESLCPSSAYFIVQNLTSIFNNGLIDIINLRMVPWGNARINRVNNSIICQNGPDECLLNTVQACAIDVLNNVDKNYGLISCIELLGIQGNNQEWETCFDSWGLPKKAVLECYNNGNGTKLEIAYGYETGHLNPPHQFVPWVLVNAQPIGTDHGNFVTYVCNAYTGSVKPRLVSHLNRRSTQLGIGSQILTIQSATEVLKLGTSPMKSTHLKGPTSRRGLTRITLFLQV